MKLTKEQEGITQRILKWLSSRPRKPAVLAGVAGTGKTTLIIELLKRLPDSVRCRTAMVTFTGKASDVLVAKLLANDVTCGYTGTIHSLFYRPQDMDTEEVTFVKKGWGDFRKEDYDLIIVDELSMVDDKTALDLVSFKLPVLFCGDNQQLTPIDSGTAGLMISPDFVLREVHRQALDNPIIQVATKIRRGEKVPFGQIGSNFIRILPKPAVVIPIVETFMHKYFVKKDGTGTMLCAANKTRHQLNARVRDKLGFSKERYPQNGEIVVCLRNHRETGLKNGTLCRVVESCEPMEPKLRKKNEGFTDFLDDTDSCYVRSLKDDKGGKLKPFIGCMTVVNLQTEAEHRVICHLPAFKGKVDHTKARAHPDWLFFDYGYALTVHKSQGSEWDSVLLFNKRLPRQTDDEYRRWWYTGATRARTKLIMVG